MKRWIFILPLFVLAYFLVKKEEASVRAPAALSKQAPPSAPLVLLAPVPAQVEPAVGRTLKLPTPSEKRIPAALQVKSDQVVPAPKAPLNQNGRRWQWLEGAVAVEANEQTAKLPRLGERPGFFVMAASDVPEGVESFPLVKREDNNVVGIFTGVLKAIGKSQLQNESQFQLECPCRVKESYPAIKSYLVSPQGEQSHEELKTCLNASGLFKKLEWEILHHANRIR